MHLHHTAGSLFDHYLADMFQQGNCCRGRIPLTNKYRASMLLEEVGVNVALEMRFIR